MVEQYYSGPAAHAASSNAAIFGGAGFAIGGWAIGASEIAAIGGLFVGIAGLAMNWYWKRKAFNLLRDRLANVPVEEILGLSDG